MADTEDGLKNSEVPLELSINLWFVVFVLRILSILPIEHIPVDQGSGPKAQAPPPTALITHQTNPRVQFWSCPKHLITR